MKLTTLLGTVRYSRAYYWCEACDGGWFPSDEEFELLRKLTPAVQQVVSMAGGLSAAFKEGSERVLHTLSGVLLSESTVLRTTEDIGQEIDTAMSAGDPVAPQGEWEWHKDAEGRSCAYMSLDATGVRQQGPHGEKAEARMVWVVEVFNPVPQPPDEDSGDKPAAGESNTGQPDARQLQADLLNAGESKTPSTNPKPENSQTTKSEAKPKTPQSQARYCAGLMDISEAGRRLRRLAETVHLEQAEVVIGLTDGGNGLADCLETHCMSGLSAKRVLILDFYHLTEHLREFGREWLKDEGERAAQVGQWCHTAKHAGGEALLKELEALDLSGASAAARESYRLLKNYVAGNLYRMDYPTYVKAGWQIGSGNIESACKTVINHRLDGGGMRWREYGTNAVSHIRALICSEPAVWDSFWRNRPKHHAA